MRNRTRASTVGIGLVLGLSLLLSSGVASAESAVALPRCEAKFTPSHGDSIPANVPAVVAQPHSSTPSLRVRHLLDAGDLPWDGDFTEEQDPRLLGARLLVPSNPLPVGTGFAADFALECESISKSGQMIVEFDVTPAVELPKVLGTATATGERIFVVPSDELAAFLPVVMFEMRARGRTLVVARYGEAIPGSDGRVALNPSVVGWCEPGEKSEKVESIEVTAHVAGTTEDPPPVVVTYQVKCDLPPPLPPRDAGPDTETTVRDDSAGGCVIGSNAPPSVWATFALGALVVVVTRRRRVVRANSVRRSSR